MTAKISIQPRVTDGAEAFPFQSSIACFTNPKGPNTVPLGHYPAGLG
jgi:hypothetical protein